MHLPEIPRESAYFWGAPTYGGFGSKCKKRRLLSGALIIGGGGALSFGTLRYLSDIEEGCSKTDIHMNLPPNQSSQSKSPLHIFNI